MTLPDRAEAELQRMRGVAWNGERLSVEEADGGWTSPYEVMAEGEALARGAASHGSGTTPPLLGFGDDEARLGGLTDAHGDFNYTDDIQSTTTETIFDTGSMTANAYGRVMTYALVHDRDPTGTGEQNGHDAYREGGTVLTDGPLCRLRIDSDGRHNTADGASPRWHDALNVWENAEGRIGGSGELEIRLPGPRAEVPLPPHPDWVPADGIYRSE